GRVRRTASYMPGSTTLYSGRQVYYDGMGRVVQWTNPTEMDGNWNAAGDDAPPAGNGWVSASRTYDWQGRPRVTTYPDSTTTELSYGGCGCAGGEVTTARDQRGRLKKTYRDQLGRLSKVEELDYNSAVYSTAVYEYNVRDQLTKVRHHQGSGGAYQERTFGYDGHGRLATRTTPEQGTTSYSYFDDDTLHVMTDARGATQTFGYTARHLPSTIAFNSAPGVATTPNVSFAYDGAGNRTQMTKVGQVTADYHYDSLSRMDWESRTFNGLGTYFLYYGYNSAGLAWVNNHWGSSVNYTIDHTGAATAVTGSGMWSAPTYVQGMQYRAFGGVKAASYGNSRALSVTYTNMLRVDEWGVTGVTGWKYYYSDFGENTGRVTFAQNTFESNGSGGGAADPTLDRSYNYDLAGRLDSSYTGSQARAHAGRAGGNWNVQDGPYGQALMKDVWGNITQKTGYGGAQFGATYTNNRRDGFSYDAAGNLTSDLGQTFTYDATGQQAGASYFGYSLDQTYDGDRLRVKKVENGVPTYYLRSSVLGGQVAAEINQSGGWQRGFVYGPGGGLLAIQTGGGVNWVYQDGATKSQRLADASGGVTAKVDLDPWGWETGRSQNSQAQPRRYTTYERDGNQSDEAMMRRYNRWQLRFDQPDPYDGSYDLGNPQSFNRYAYTNNDPVNFTDPSGLTRCITQNDGDGNSWLQCWDDGHPNDVIVDGRRVTDHITVTYDADFLFVLGSQFDGYNLSLNGRGGGDARGIGSTQDDSDDDAASPLKLHKGDKWYGRNNKDFHKWFHRCWKEAGEADADKEEVEAAYEEWLSRGSPKGGSCFGGQGGQPQHVPRTLRRLMIEHRPRPSLWEDFNRWLNNNVPPPPQPPPWLGLPPYPLMIPVVP
ncbi:MAG: RHS repeat-associated core domain-containing protein, partial [Pyrinomonadaceae bacterium]